MSNLEALSDVELRQKLLQHGFPNIPLTETTRPLMIKNLKTYLMKNKRSKSPHLGSRNAHIQIVPSKSQYERLRESIQTPMANVLEVESVPPFRSASIFLQSNNNSVQAAQYNYNQLTNQQAPLPQEHREKRQYACYPPKNLPNQHIGIVNRLLSFRGKTTKQQYEMLNSVDDSDALNLNIFKRNTKHVNVAAKAPMGQIKNTQFSIQTIIPYALISAFLIFIISLIFIYMKMSTDIVSYLDIHSTKYIECADVITISSPTDLSSNCMTRGNVMETLHLIKELIQLLQQRIENACIEKSTPARLTIGEFINHLEKYKKIDSTFIMNDIEKMKYLINQNLNWKIGIIDHKSFTKEDNLNIVTNGGNAFVLLSQSSSLKCLLYNKLQKFFTIIGIGLIIAIVVKTSLELYKVIKKRYSNRTTTVENFITDIINELIQHASYDEGNEEVILNHLRDKLVPINKRKSNMWAWEKALTILEKNDSRVIFGVKMQNGQEFRSIKWIGNKMNNPDRTTAKQWQSPAFNNLNNIVNPPTQCLKIRHMFDYTEVGHPQLLQILSKSIIEKVGPNCKIIDIQVDLQSCCVYVRCATEEDAGIVHDKINGWWFDKRLVSIKFLRLQRYLARFPNAKRDNLFSPDCKVSSNISS